MDAYQQYIHKSRYARYLPDKKRREHLEETVRRFVTFMSDHLGKRGTNLNKVEWNEIEQSILSFSTMPSMRSMMTAGPALLRDNTGGYNCSYVTVDDPKAFDETMHILMNGSGVGFSVERQYIAKLPEIPDKLFDSDMVIVVKDSKAGWAKGFRTLISLLYAGEIPTWDTSKVRPAGAVLKTFGGRASGPEPLEDLFRFTINMFKQAAGRKLTSIECHDIMCKIGEVVVVGGVRRCLPSGSMVHTKLGMKPIEDIIPNFDEVLTSDGYRHVSNLFDQGKQQLLEIVTQDSTFKCTENHKIAVLDGVDSYIWKRAKDLDFGDRLVAPSNPIYGKETSLPKFTYNHPKGSTTCRGINIPNLDVDVAWLLGIIQGDGYVKLTPNSGEVSISFHKDQEEFGKRAEKILKRFGVNVGWIRYENYFVVRTKSKQLAQYFSEWLKQPKTELQIPQFIWDSKENIKLSYCRGLFDSDGSEKTRPMQLLCSVYEQFCNDVRLLMSSCGHQLRVKKLSTANLKENWQEKYAVVFINNISKLAFGLKESKSEQNTNSYPKEFLDFGYPNNYPWSKTDNKLIPVSVVDVSYTNEFEQTWDIEVEGMHEFFCEGYLMHNSAMISLSNLSDDRMRAAKSGEWWHSQIQRSLANNSAVYNEKPPVATFMDEWKALYDSKSGERGIFSRDAAKRIAGRSGRRDIEHEFGTNPCSEIILRPNQFCVAPNTPLITKENGIQPISSFVDKMVSVWNGEEWTPVTVRKTGSNQKLMRVYLNDGSYLDCTSDHRWSVKDRFSKNWKEIETKDLMATSKYSMQVEPCDVKEPEGGVEIDNAYTIGFAVGDGCVYNNQTLIDLHGSKDWMCPVEGNRHKKQLNQTGTSEYIRCNATEFAKPNLIKSLKENGNIWTDLIGFWDKKSVMSFVAGLADADGSETDSGGIRIYINSYEKGRALQLLLAKFGMRCSINLHQKEGTPTNLCLRKRDSWYVQITDCEQIPCHRLDVSGGHEPKFKGKYQNINRVEELDGLHDTYCFNEPKRHKGMFGNVLTYQCNLTEVVARADDTDEDLDRKVKIATIIGTIQSTLTHFPYLRKVWTNNTEEERLLGVSITGIYDCPLLNKVNKETKDRLARLKRIAVNINKEYASRFGIPQSTAVTCVKPSGTVSQLTDSASGIHPRFDPYYFRRVRSDNKDPLTQFMKDAGVPHEPDVTKPESTTVFTFPHKAPKGAMCRDAHSAIDHLNLWLMYQQHWCEHKPSVTISVKEDEWMSVGAWVYENFDEISGISFLPYDGGTYRQAPYETITRETYLEAKKSMPTELNWDGFAEVIDNVEGVQTLACSAAGGCDI